MNVRGSDVNLEQDKHALYENIKMLCKEYGITVAQLELDSGLTRGSVSKWPSTFPSWDKLLKVAEYFNVSIDFLVGRTNNRDAHKPLDLYVQKLVNGLKPFRLNDVIVSLLLDVVAKIQSLLN